MSEAPTLQCPQCGEGQNGTHRPDCAWLHPWLGEMESWVEREYGARGFAQGFSASKLVEHMRDWLRKQAA